MTWQGSSHSWMRPFSPDYLPPSKWGNLRGLPQKIALAGCPSGQWEGTVNPPALPSKVQILHPPPDLIDSFNLWHIKKPLEPRPYFHFLSDSTLVFVRMEKMGRIEFFGEKGFCGYDFYCNRILISSCSQLTGNNTSINTYNLHRSEQP